MKRKLNSVLVILSFIVAGFTTQSCEKIKDLVAFDVEQNLPGQYFALDSTTTTKSETILHQSSFKVNLDSIFAANGIDKGTISSGQFKSILLSIVNPTADAQFGFLSDIRFVVSETENFAGEEIIAEAHNIQKGDISLTLAVNSNAIDKYINNRQFFYRVYGTLVGPVPVRLLPLVMDSKIGFTVKPLE
jgi:hypothetical protein